MINKKYFILEPASFKLDGGAMFGIIPKPLWHKVHPADEENRIDLALRLLLIQIKDDQGECRNVLIDTGIGDFYDDKFKNRFGIKGPSHLHGPLSQIGLCVEDITDLVISHLHFDHVGGIGTKDVNGKMAPVLPRALVHLHQKHFEYAKNPTERDAGSFRTDEFLPVIEWYQKNKQIHFVDGEEGEIFKGLNFRCSHGHTPFLLHPFDEHFIYMADLVPTSNHINVPWVMGYDISPGISTQDKKNFYQMIIKQNLTMIFEHDPKYYGARLEKIEDSYKAKEKFPSANQLCHQIFITSEQ